MVGQGIRLREVATNPKWQLLTDGDAMLVHVILAKAEEAAAATVEATPTPTAEPEVIKKGKKDEAEAAEKTDKKK